MHFSDLIKARYSVRDYKSTVLSKELLLELLEATSLAPSAVNFQPWHFIIVQQPDLLEKLKQCYKREWIKTAPAIIIACADHTQSWKRSSDNKDFADVDVSIAIDHLTLKATEMGLGTCWVCNFDVEQCSALFNLPESIEPIALIPIGYPNSENPGKKRKAVSEIVHFDEFKC